MCCREPIVVRASVTTFANSSIESGTCSKGYICFVVRVTAASTDPIWNGRGNTFGSPNTDLSSVSTGIHRRGSLGSQVRFAKPTFPRRPLIAAQTSVEPLSWVHLVWKFVRDPQRKERNTHAPGFPCCTHSWCRHIQLSKNQARRHCSGLGAGSMRSLGNSGAFNGKDYFGRL